MRLPLLVVILIMLISSTKAQNRVIIGEKVIKTTPKFEFYQITDGKIGGFPLNVTFGIDENQVLVILSLNKGHMSTGVRIGGELLIYLDDDSVIRCVDRKLSDNANGIISTIYHLSSEEFSKLQKINLYGIRFSEISGVAKSDFIFYNTNFEEEFSVLKQKVTKVDVPKYLKDLSD